MNISQKIDCEYYYNNIKSNIKEYMKHWGTDKPMLLILAIGDDKASKSYLKGNIRDCDELNIDVRYKNIEGNKDTYQVMSDIQRFIRELSPDGVILQLPIPDYLDEKLIKSMIPEGLDIDGLNPNSRFRPCTAAGIMNLLAYNKINIEGKHVVIINRSSLIGKPLMNMMLDNNATVTICHSKTDSLSTITKVADIIVSATGQASLIKPDMIKPDSILIDAGISVDANGLVCGDISKECHQYCKAYTTVPNGIGLVTRATLLKNIMSVYTSKRFN